MSEDTIFHKIIRKEIPAKIVYEDDSILAFHDVNPVSPTHILLIPKKTLPSLASVTDEDEQVLGRLLVKASQIAQEQGLSEDGYRIVINCGGDGGQTVHQLHLHLLGGRAFAWPPG